MVQSIPKALDSLSLKGRSKQRTYERKICVKPDATRRFEIDATLRHVQTDFKAQEAMTRRWISLVPS
jgi:hypothetical protein